MLLYHADVLRTVERADAFHIDAEVRDVDVSRIVQEVIEEVSADADSIRRGLRSSPDHRLYQGEGRFVDERTVEVADGDDRRTRIRAETILLAAGTRPAIPPLSGIEEVEYLTSDEALQLDEPPAHLVIVGGGYIAAELGHFFGSFGSDITIVSRRPTLLPEADEDVSAALTERSADRFTVHTGYEATALSQTASEVTVAAHPYEYGNDGGVQESDPVRATGESVLIAAGRTPNSDTLNLDAGGVETDENGFVRTDEYLRTTAEGVWAIGDIVGEYLFKHSANHEAQAVARNLFVDDPEPVDDTAMPFGVFADPEVAGVGAREWDLPESAAEYATRTYRYDQTARGTAMQADGFVKAIIDLDGEILGCHIIGPEATDLIQEVVVAMRAGSGTV